MFSIGQRWYSQAEPELGLGVVEAVADRQVSLLFAAAQELRNYNMKSAPLRRHALAPGDEACDEEGLRFIVEEVKEQNEVLFYFGEGHCMPETALKSDISLIRPEERLLQGTFDSNDFFNFRYETMLLTRALQGYQARGLEGSRINLIGHQISIFADVADKIHPKLVLADEVGLGKTIEAGLLAKRLIEKKLVKSVLILAPQTLQYQWFFELFKKFDLLFKTLGAGDDIELSAKVENDDFLIANIKFLSEEHEAKQLVLEKDWDLVIVDEAHRFRKETEGFELLKEVTQKAKSAFYLSATPEALGEENFFELLKLLNPQKYSSYERYVESEAPYREAKDLSPQLLERYNYERDTFRNRRKNLEKHKELFPKKALNAIELKIDRPSDRKVIEAKVDLLAEFVRENPGKKVFAIGKSRALAVQAQKMLTERIPVNVSLFHGDQTLLERDRQAAYFSDPEGAQVLISAESGSEGRNFEFASELFLLDFPLHPQLLLQRIGRLDRIGQKNTVTIHAPYVANSPEENLFRLYHEAFNLFERFPTGLIEFYEDRNSEIKTAMESHAPEKIQSLASDYKKFQETVEKAKNRFLDAHSFKQSNVDEMRDSIRSFHREKDLQAYLEKAFNFVGVDIEEISKMTYFIRPSDNMLIPSYPNLPAEGFSYTISREKALARDDLRFMTFESPLLRGTMELFTEGELGNASAVTHNGQLGENLFLEFIFKVEPKQLYYNDISRFFPLTPVRVLLDAQGADLTAKFPKKRIDAVSSSLDEAHAMKLSQGLPKQAVADLVAKARAHASQRAQKYKSKALEEIESYYGKEIDKLQDWGADNEFSQNELKKLKTAREELLKQTERLGIELDSVRLIV